MPSWSKEPEAGPKPFNARAEGISTKHSGVPCAIVTIEANSLMQPLHNRTPVILDTQAGGARLDPENRHPEDLLRPLHPGALEAWQVGPAVGNVRGITDPTLQQPGSFASANRVMPIRVTSFPRATWCIPMRMAVPPPLA